MVVNHDFALKKCDFREEGDFFWVRRGFTESKDELFYEIWEETEAKAEF